MRARRQGGHGFIEQAGKRRRERQPILVGPRHTIGSPRRSLAGGDAFRKHARVSADPVSPAEAQPHPPVRTHHLRGWQKLVLWPLGLLLRAWGRTLRFELDPEDRAAFEIWDRPVALAMWHNRLFLSAEIIRRCRRGKTFHGLISASRDGAWLEGFFRLSKISAVRGSSSRGAREAVSALIEVLRAGHDIGITPDGPRGPKYEFKPGGLIVARRAGAPMILIGAEFSHAKALPSWDGFYVPRPFSRVRIRSRQIDPAALPRDREAALAELTQIMDQLNREPGPDRTPGNAPEIV